MRTIALLAALLLVPVAPAAAEEPGAVPVTPKARDAAIVGARRICSG